MGIRYISGGESHGPRLTCILEGLPAGVKVSSDFVNAELKRRQGGYGRGGRMKIESDSVEFLSGIRRNARQSDNFKRRKSRLEKLAGTHERGRFRIRR